LDFRALKRWGFQLLLVFLTLGFIVACQGQKAMMQQSPGGECKVVDHLAEKTCIPKQFERLVTLDGVMFEYAIAANLDPIATVSSDFQAQLPPLMTDAQNIGKGGEPSLEAILSLQPDLIVGLDFHQGIYPQLSQMAPTLLVPFEHSGQWKEVFLKTGTALNQEEAALSELEAYQARTAEFQAQMGKRLNALQVSVIRLYPDTINLYLRDSFCGTVLQDAGLARPPSQDIEAGEAEQRFGNPIQTSVSRELLTQADGDVIFIWTGENTAEGNQEAQKRLQALQRDPLWGQLKAVQAGQVYEVPSYWIGNGPIAANAILDDLFKYLVEEA